MTALARSASSSKPAYTNLAAQGVKVVAIDLDGPEDELAKALQGQDVVIASVIPNSLESQLPLIRAAKLPNVNRFVPSAFAMAIAPSSISTVHKEVRCRPGSSTAWFLRTVIAIAERVAEGKNLR